MTYQELAMGQMPLDLVTRDQLAATARAQGMNLTARTIRYWASMGWIPKPWRLEGEGLRAFYPLSLLERLRVLSALRPDNLRELKDNIGEAETIQFGEETFSVLPAIARWERDSTEFSVRMLEDGSGMLLIQKKRK